jgi:16S rRNA (guanine527-N7)-methyltransferase
MATDEDLELEAVLTASRDLGFLGPGESWIHVEHALAFARAVPQAPTHALDLGSGGGVPGLILARLVWPNANWCLLDGSVKRVAFLDTAIAQLGLGERVVARAGRAEEVGRGVERASFDLVVARSFGPPAVVAECAAPFLVVGGHLVVSEPPDTDPTARWDATGLADFGLALVDHPVGPPALAVLTQTEPCPERWPRRVGIPTKRPHFTGPTAPRGRRSPS